MRILVGLGNPGAKYERTRHNIGFRIAEEAARKLDVALGETRWNAVFGLGQGQAAKTAVLLPQTFMNLSGEPTGHAARFWKVTPAGIVVAHDASRSSREAATAGTMACAALKNTWARRTSCGCGSESGGPRRSGKGPIGCWGSFRKTKKLLCGTWFRRRLKQRWQQCSKAQYRR
jgi:Peptidyl-tRNA hydrolase